MPKAKKKRAARPHSGRPFTGEKPRMRAEIWLDPDVYEAVAATHPETTIFSRKLEALLRTALNKPDKIDELAARIRRLPAGQQRLLAAQIGLATGDLAA
jgi:hypothetical protein